MAYSHTDVCHCTQLDKCLTNLLRDLHKQMHFCGLYLRGGKSLLGLGDKLALLLQLLCQGLYLSFPGLTILSCLL